MNTKTVFPILVVVVVVLGVGLAYVLVTPRTAGPTSTQTTTQITTQTTTATQPVSVRMSPTPWSTFASLYDTFDEVKDIWEGIEAKYNVSFTWSWTEEDVSTFFYGGSDVVFVGPLEAAEIRFNRGLDVYVLSNTLWNEDALVVRGDATYTSVTDMVGQKLANFGFDSGAYKYAEVLWAHEYGIDASTDFEWIVPSPDVAVELTRTGDVEGAIVYGGPWAIGLADYGMKLLYGPYTEELKRLTGEYGAAIEAMVIRKDIVDAHPEVAKALVDGWIQLYEFMLQDPDYYYQKFLEVSYGLTTQAQLDAFIEYQPFELHIVEAGPLTDGQIASDMQLLTWAYELGLLDQMPTEDLFYRVTLP